MPGILVSSLDPIDTLQSTDLFLVTRTGIDDFKATTLQVASQISAFISGSVVSVSNSDSTITISPTSGSVVASLNLSKANTWLATQSFPATSIGAAALVGTDIVTVGTVTAGTWNATTIAVAHGGTGQTTSVNAINALLPAQGSSAGQFLTTNGSLASWGNAVGSVTNGDSSITFSPTTGAVVGSLNVGHTNTWTAKQKINLNVSPAPAVLTGTVLQLSQADATASRLELNAFSSTAFFTSVGWGGSAASPTALTLGTQIGGYNSFGYNGSAVVGPVVTYRTFAAEDWQASPAHQGSYAEIATTLTGSTTLGVVARFENDGGTTFPNTVTGGSKGVGTINVSGRYYVNGGGIPFSNLIGTDIASLGTVTVGTWNATTIGVANGGTGQTSASNAINALLPAQTTASGKFLTSDGSVASWASVVGGVTSVTNSDSTITFSPTTGAVIGSLNLAHANTWVGIQTFTTPVLGVASATSINKVTITAPASGATLTIANGFTLTVPANASVAGTNTGDVANTALTTGTLAQFASTTSSQLAGVISDATGSGSLVFATSPSLGVVTATSINKVTITQPATGSTLTVADGVTLTASTTGTVAILAANSFTGSQSITLTDSNLNNALTCLTLDHETSGTKTSIVAGYGGSISLLGTDTTSTSQPMGAIQWTWTTPTHASASSQIAFQTVSNAGALSTGLIVGSGISGATAGLIIGGVSSVSGGLWSSAVTPSNNNYALVANSSTTLINVGSGFTVGMAVAGNSVVSASSSLVTISQPTTTTGSLTTTIADATTNAVNNAITLQHNCTTLSSTAAGFGTGIAFNLGDTTTTNQNAAAINAVWTTATHASRASQIQFQTSSNAGALSTGLFVGSGISGATAGVIIGGATTVEGGIWYSGFTPSVNNIGVVLNSTSSGLNAPSGGTLFFNVNGSATGQASMTSSAWAFSSPSTTTITAIGTAATAGNTLVNTTAAAAGAQQYSPALQLSGQGWKTTATAASQQCDWQIQCVPVQGTTAPTANLTFNNQINGGGFGSTPTLTLTSSALMRLNTAFGALGYSFATDPTTGMASQAAGVLMYANNMQSLFITSTNVQVNGSLQLGWSFTSASTAFDTGFARSSAGIIRITNGSTGSGSLIVGTSTTTYTQFSSSNGLISTYNAIATAGIGVPAIYGLDNRIGLTTADGAPITLYTSTGANQLYRVSADIFPTAAVTGTANYTVTWTENATTQTTVVSATLVNTDSTSTKIIRPDNATAITVQLTGTFTGSFSVVGLVERLA